jgi:hypothetical protein
MNTLTVTAKGHVTLRKELLEPLGIQPGKEASRRPDFNGRGQICRAHL